MKDTKISWATHTFNPWEGCTKVSEGCAHCYAATRNGRFHGGENWGRGAPRRRTSEAYWKQPFMWNRAAGDAAAPVRVFCASLADWLDDEVPIEWLADLLRLIHDTQNIDWLVLSKRPENFYTRLQAVDRLESGSQNASNKFLNWLISWKDYGEPPANVWVGTSVENQRRADERIPVLLGIPAVARFLSCEPLLGALHFRPEWSGKINCPAREVPGACGFTTSLPDAPRIHWVIAGGESGPGHRPMEVEWAHSLRDRCKSDGVAFFMKQLGGHPDKRGSLEDFPDDLRVREFPDNFDQPTPGENQKLQ